MGCDIHMNVEVRRNGRWTFVEPPEIEESWNKDSHGRQLTRKTWWDDRSYVTFSVLAGVRASQGYGGSPISEPRGYPDDADPETINQDYPAPRGQDHGDHSATWLTLHEVLAFDWDQSFQEDGVVSIEEYVRCKNEKDTPNSWSGGISGPEIVTMSVKDADAWLTTPEAEIYLLGRIVDGRQLFGMRNVQMEWTSKLSDRCASFLTWARSLPKMLKAAPKDIRLVFSFDS